MDQPDNMRTVLFRSLEMALIPGLPRLIGGDLPIWVEDRGRVVSEFDFPPEVRHLIDQLRWHYHGV